VAALIVCISRELGAEAEVVGRLVAERLGLQYVDEEVIERAAERGGVEQGFLEDVEARKSRLRRVVDLLADSGSGSGAVAPETALRASREESHRSLIRGVVEEVARDGNAVIVAHAASMALGGQNGVLRVLVTASPAVRAKRIAEQRGVDDKQAGKVVRESEAARAEYVKRFYGIDRELPTHYDIVVNTDTLAPERAAEVIALAAESSPAAAP
jgi:cytidylate kinase